MKIINEVELIKETDKAYLVKYKDIQDWLPKRTHRVYKESGKTMMESEKWSFDLKFNKKEEKAIESSENDLLHIKEQLENALLTLNKLMKS